MIFNYKQSPEGWGLASILTTTAMCQQPRLLPQCHDPTRPALHRFLIRSPRNPVITGKGDQFLDVGVCVVPEFDGVRKIVRPPHCHFGMGEHNKNTVNRFVWEEPLWNSLSLACNWPSRVRSIRGF